MEGDGFGSGSTPQGFFCGSFVQVQSLLDQNRLLIDEISRNQESRVPADLARNIGLIRELNHNFRRVVDLYAVLSTGLSQSSEGNSTGGLTAGVKRDRDG
ncbi:hypothetical protein MLD38_015085 [Melastoma candidum]|uniref:Uncharacterized protein n=1 Tax=Melastoma candidum TaxID=119954 RepID=A0ACB9RI17_9MYRT|nr:hypothetical protein MLD38_015085 [Melastoma candidum]